MFLGERLDTFFLNVFIRGVYASFGENTCGGVDYKKSNETNIIDLCSFLHVGRGVNLIHALGKNPFGAQHID